MATTQPTAEFVYVTYIASTPEKVWDALINPELTKDWWGRHRNASDWKVGSRWTHQDYDDATKVDLVGEVLEAEPPKRLVVTWAFPHEPQNASRVTYDIAPFMGAVRLTLRHIGLEAGSMMHEGISAGWPAVLSSLKTLLETGSALPMTLKRFEGPPPKS